MSDAIIYQGLACYSFRQLDELGGVPKGSSFRAFKRAGGQLVEGRDYFYLRAEDAAEWIASLRAEGRVYAGTHHLVLLTEPGRRRLEHAAG